MKHKQQLMILPFDHRSSFTKNLLGYEGNLSKIQIAKVKSMKNVVYEAFRKVVVKYKKDRSDFGILVDEQFGRHIYDKAKTLGVKTCETLEKSGQKIFDFEYGSKDFQKHIEKVNPSYVKALVRYNPANKTQNKTQLKRLKKLSNYCIKTNRKLLFELLVPPTQKELKAVKGNKKAYDKTKRIPNTIKAIKEIAKVLYVDVWKLEGFDTSKAWQSIINAISTGINPDDYGIVVLGRGETKKKVEFWLRTAAKFPKINGFAVGRTVFFESLEQLKQKKIKRQTAINNIAKEFEYFVKLWLEEKQIKLE